VAAEIVEGGKESAAPGSTPTADILSPAALFRRRFMRHRLAVVSAVVVAAFYLVVIFADFIAYSDPTTSNSDRALVPPQSIHLFDNGRFAPHVHGLKRTRHPETFGLVYVADEATTIPVVLFAKGYEYRLFGLFPTSRRLIGTAGAPTESSLFLFGADEQGRDLFSRIVHAIRTSLLIGLAAVAVSITVGMVIGTISGYYGGYVDLIIQRIIEILLSIPTIPLWMGLAAAIPPTWGITLVYLTVTLIIALVGWTQLARELRGKIMALRREDFVTAAELSGARPSRIMFVHLLPLTTSHIIATTTLAIPAMIASETALGFLGLGLRPPAISLGVLLSSAQSLQNVALYSWMLIPAIPTAIIIIAFNFLGDGLRDAADPNS